MCQQPSNSTYYTRTVAQRALPGRKNGRGSNMPRYRPVSGTSSILSHKLINVSAPDPAIHTSTPPSPFKSHKPALQAYFRLTNLLHKSKAETHPFHLQSTDELRISLGLLAAVLAMEPVLEDA